MIVIMCCTASSGDSENEENNNTNTINNDGNNANDIPINSNDTELQIKDNEEAESDYQKAYNKWTEKNKSQNYYLKVSYKAFSPITGIWEIDVENDQIVKSLFKGEELKDDDMFKDSAKQFKMENLFDIAKRSYQKTETSLFFVIAKYDDELGYVKQIRKVVNPDIPSEQIPTDQTYRYDVLDYQQK